MIRKTQSIDGFILKRRDNASPDDAEKHVFLDSVPSTQKPTKQEAGLRRAEVVSIEDDISDDVEVSLQGLETKPDQFTESDKKSRRRQNKKFKPSKKNSNKQAIGKRHHPIRRIIKWFFIILSVTTLVLVGWLAVKALMTSGKIFQGSILDIFTSKTRLAEDKNGRTNVLIFGTEGYGIDNDDADGGFLTDSIMVLSVDQDKHDAYMISLPRDLWVERSCPALGTSSGKLNETYYCNYGIDAHENKASEHFMKIIGGITGLEVQYFVHMDYAAFEEIINAVGGVDVHFEEAMYDVATKFKAAAGETVHMDGKLALNLARSRGAFGGYGLAGSNFARERNQQKILVALKEKALSAEILANPLAINSMLDALGDNLRTNFKTSEVQTLIDLTKDIKSENMISLPLVDREDGGLNLVTTGMIGSISIVRPVLGLYDYSDIIDYIRQSVKAAPDDQG